MHRLRGCVTDCRKANSDSVSVKQTVRVLGVSEGKCLARTTQQGGRLRGRGRGVSTGVRCVYERVHRLSRGHSQVVRRRSKVGVKAERQDARSLLRLQVSHMGEEQRRASTILAIILLNKVTNANYLTTFSKRIVFDILTNITATTVSMTTLFFHVQLDERLGGERHRERH